MKDILKVVVGLIIIVIAFKIITGIIGLLIGIALAGLVVYGGVSLAVLRLRHRDGSPRSGAFTIPGGPAIPVLSCVVVAWLLWQLTAEEAVGLAALVGVAVCLYALRSLSGWGRAQRP